MPNGRWDIEGEVTFLPAHAGGRERSVFDGYRAQFFYDGHDWDAIQRYPDVEQVNPGDTVRAQFAFISPDEHWGRLRQGTLFLLREGQRVVAYGKVTAVLDLQESARLKREQAEREAKSIRKYAVD